MKDLQKVCSVCGKKFFRAPLHLYKTMTSTNKTLHQCSYTCYRKAGGDKGYNDLRNH